MSESVSDKGTYRAVWGQLKTGEMVRGAFPKSQLKMVTTKKARKIAKKAQKLQKLKF